MAVVGEAVLSASLQVLFDKLASPDLLKFSRQEQVHTALKKWERMLLKIHAVLNDAEEKQITNRAVKIWLDELRDLAYDVEDILDEFATEALRRKLMDEPQASTSKVRTLLFPTCCASFGPRAVMFNIKMGSKIEEITTKLEEISKEKNDLDLRENAGGRSIQVRERRLPTTSLVYESRVYGREKDKEAILELLLKNEACGDEVCVIPIIGMGGVGKTTLAKLVYNDEKVKGCFALKAWACVSEVFDVFMVTKTILDSVTSETCESKDLNLLQVKLKEKLSGKKFLLVLDDVWNENYHEWDVLCDPLRAGAQGSKIIVTTRNEGVVSITGAVSAYPLKELSNDDCLSLFTQHALGTTTFEAHPNLKEIGEEIVKRCKGLPLAAKALGGLLRSKINPDEWVDILRSKIWDLPEEKTGILPALRLSYDHLPSHLKQCFTYCSIFPKDYEFDKDELVLLWMAEGFLQQSKGSKQMEDLGCEYFSDLLSRSFFQQSSSSESQFVMHDLINDLAKTIAGKICFQLEDKFEGNERYNISKRARHSSYIRGHFDGFKRFEVFHEQKCLRTFLALPINAWGPPSYLTTKVLHDLLPKLRCIRVLSLSGYRISELPDSIGDLKHLRYLNLSRSLIKSLPESVGALYNLQTLILRRCSYLIKLPTGIRYLINLRHLDITDTDALQEMPLGLANLKNLKNLSKFIVGKDGGLSIRELRDLLYLQGKLSISGLHNVVDIRDASDANLKDKHDLEQLEMEWSWDFDDSRNERDETEVLEFLQPNRNLKVLSIELYGGTKFPSWIGDPSFSKIMHISISNCRKCTSLPPLGQLPLLKDLCIEGMDGVKSVGVEFYGDGFPCVKPFPRLESLWFLKMPEWEDWSLSIGAHQEDVEVRFPRLQVLKIVNCPKLVGKFRNHLSSLVKLNFSGCSQLAVSHPTLCELNLYECSEVALRSVIDLTSLTTLRIGKILGLTCLAKGFMQFLVALEVLEINCCDELTSLWQTGSSLQSLARLKSLRIAKCSQLVSLAEEEQGLPCNLERLTLHNCGNLGKLPNGLHCLARLKSLEITECSQLVSLAEEEQGLPCSLECLTLHNCGNLGKLPNGLHSLTSLRELRIRGCPKLVCFPKTGLPPMLTYLEIYGCDALESLPNGMMMQSDDNNNINNTCPLEVLKIGSCSSLTSFPRGELPTTLKELQIMDWPQLESLSERMLHNNGSLESLYISKCLNLKSLPECLFSLTHLINLDIGDCAGIKSFPERGLSSTPNLRRLGIWNCMNLKSLPHHMQSLTSLQELRISVCPGLVSFPQEGLPPNLISLKIVDCENLNLISESGLHRLTSLKTFVIGGGCPPDMVSFPNECMLPTTITYLWIKSLPNLESLSMGLQNLTSLQHLYILECPKLRLLPKEGVLATLSNLSIRKCPLLKQRWLKEKGEDWPKIAHIARVEIDEIEIH